MEVQVSCLDPARDAVDGRQSCRHGLRCDRYRWRSWSRSYPPARLVTANVAAGDQQDGRHGCCPAAGQPHSGRASAAGKVHHRRLVMESTIAINLRGVWQSYGHGQNEVSVLRDLDLEVAAGGYLALVGESGAGKSTLLAILGGLQRARSGNVVVAGCDVSALGGGQLAGFRRDTIGFIFQHAGLLEVLSAQQNVELAMALAGMPRRLRALRAVELLESVGLGQRRNHPPSRLSGGERQRVAVARALANRPQILLADEPTGNLDPQAAGLVLEALEKLRLENGCTLLVVTHNPVVALRAPLRLRLSGGRMEAA